MTLWTSESVLALAPDPASAKAGQGLSATRQWSSLGVQDHALWGEIKGSGATPYQARIDLREPAFKCSCPSRKFPCKHGIALLLAYVREASAFPSASAPEWVTAWLAGRDQRSEKRADPVAGGAPVDPAAQARRVEKREARVAAGLDQLDRWLGDLMRLGLAKARAEPPAFWEAMAARLVDAQAAGLARLVRELEGITQSGVDWEARLLHAVARLVVIRRAYQNRAALPPALTEELRSVIGWTQTQEDLDREPAISDHWEVQGAIDDQDDRLRVRRTWLWGRSAQRWALLLDFAACSQPLAAALPVGYVIEAALVYYPGALPLRAAIRTRTGSARAEYHHAAGAPSIAAALGSFAAALAQVPWIERVPFRLAAVRVTVTVRDDGDAVTTLCDQANQQIALSQRFQHGWPLLAASGGQPFDLFGEWDGHVLHPLRADVDGEVYSLSAGFAKLRARIADAA